MNIWVQLLISLAVSGGVLALMRGRRISKWFVASVPWWMGANDSGWFELTAALLTLGGFIALAVGPTLPGRIRGRKNVAPLPHLANGALVTVTPGIYPGARSSRVLEVLTIVMFCLTAALGIATATGSVGPEIGALALSFLIISITFAFSIWFSGRVRMRIDQEGVHSRVMFGEHTIRWQDVAGITLRNVFFPGMGMRLVYYVVYSSTTEFAFPSSTAGAKELQAAIEAATGLTFPEPTIVPNM